MKLRRIEQVVMTDGAGEVRQIVGGASDPYIFTGLLYAISYVKDSGNPYSAGVDFSLQILPNDGSTESEKLIWEEANVDADAVRFPRIEVTENLQGGSIVQYGTNTIIRMIPVVDERISIYITNGGASNVGTFHIFVLDFFDYAGGLFI